jgi:hypothetical protein
MKQQEQRHIRLLASQAIEATGRRQDDGRPAPAYCAPQLLVIGRAVDLVQRSSSGHLIDGNGGWYVWGS